jgi:UTP-glucose-1-phosphate uridylyltransferase
MVAAVLTGISAPLIKVIVSNRRKQRLDMFFDTPYELNIRISQKRKNERGSSRLTLTETAGGGLMRWKRYDQGNVLMMK